VSLPALWGVRRAFPNARIGFLSNSDRKNPHYVSADKVLPKDGLIDEWFTYPTNLGKVASVFATLKLIFELRRRKFDAVVYLMPRIRTPQQIGRDKRFFRLAGVSKFIGVNYLEQTGLREPIPKPTPTVESEGHHLLHCLSFDGVLIDETNLKPDLLLNDDEISEAKSWLNGIVGKRDEPLRLIAVAPGSKWESKVWAEDRYVTVVNRLISEYGVLSVVFGGGEDREKGDRLIARWKSGVNSAGRLSVRESAALLGECELYLGNDTGTMHLAAAAGIKCVAIFASIDWKGRWAPFGDGHQVFRQTVECEGCHSPICFNDHKCLSLTGTDEVYEACSHILGSASDE